MMDSPCSSSGSSTKLQNKFRKDKRNVYCSDLHSEVNNDASKTPSSEIYRMQHNRSKGLQKEELVKYMSKLPSFLEKGQKVEAKPLHLGVLDWNTLENWQNYHPQRPSSRNSKSRRITSSSLWTDRSSNYYGRGDGTCSPSGHKGSRPSLHSYLNIYPIEGHSRHVESHAPNVANYTDIKAISINPLDKKQNIPRESVLPVTSAELKLKKWNRESLDVLPATSAELKLRKWNRESLDVLPATSAELRLRKWNRESLDSQKTRSSTDFQKHGVPSSKEKLRVRADTSKLETKKFQDRHNNSTQRGFSDGYNDVVLPRPEHRTRGFFDAYNDGVLPRPGDNAENINVSPSHLTQRSRELNESISSDGFHFPELYSTELHPSISDSCAATRETNGSQEPHKEQKFSCSVSRATSNILEGNSIIMPRDSTLTKSLKLLNMKSTNLDSESQNPSPSCRLRSLLYRRRRKGYHFRASSDVLQLSSEDVTAKSGSEIADSFVCQNNATNDQSNAGSRDHFSPLKRLLNPLQKIKFANSKFFDYSPRNSTSTRRSSTTFDEQRELSALHPPRVKLDFTNLRTPNLDGSHRHKIQESSTLQAYFQVSAKNDLPLFTFAVDNNSDALAATLRKFSSRKNDPTWIYTFFRVQEMRRKGGGWLSQGSKVKDYVPNVVAQMKVSDLPFSGLGEHLTGDLLSTREFILYAVDLRLFGNQICDVQPNDELAAIVVKFPRKIVADLKGSSQNVRVSSISRDVPENRSIIGNQELFSTTVLLPDGIHGLPSKGEPSPLIERWFSGGQCDCGGWDLDCKLKVLRNNNRKPNGHFELYSQSQEKAQQATPFLKLSSLKNGIYSVEFDSTLTLLQAFSICVAVFDSMKPAEFQQPSHFVEEVSEEAILPNDCRLSTAKLVEVDVPTRFASKPPRTRVERV